MERRAWISRWPWRLLAPVAGVLLVLGGTLPAYARTRPQPVTA